MAKCFMCGTEKAETWRFCSERKEFVCKECETKCEHYSEVMLVNGTNCHKLMEKESILKRLLAKVYIAMPEDVEKAKEFWRKKEPTDYPALLKSAIDKYNKITDYMEGVQKRARARAYITALQQLIIEGEKNEV